MVDVQLGETRRFDRMEAFDAAIIEWIETRPAPVAIVGGHFRVPINNATTALVPEIAEGGDGGELGRFPIDTFERALTACIDVAPQGSKIALLVNDHQIFGSPRTLSDELSRSNDIGALRRTFYREGGPVPEQFASAMKAKEVLLEDVILRNDRRGRSRNSILPPDTFYFSEQALRNRFDNATRKRLLQRPGFIEEQAKGASSAVYYAFNGENYNRLCLTESGRCGCMGEIVQFMIRLEELGYEHVLMMIPDECAGPVASAVQAAHYGAEIGQSAAVVLGLGGLTFGAQQGRPLRLFQCERSEEDRH